MKDVVIDINSTYSIGSEDEDSLEFTTDGYYFLDGDTACISYYETEVTGMEGTRTSVFVMPDRVVVDRDGLITSRMVFKEGQRCDFLYSTPFGESTLGLRTRRIAREMDPNGGRVKIDYEVSPAHSQASHNLFQISVREIKQ